MCIRDRYDGTSGGHLGVKKTYDKIRKLFFWLHLRHDLEEWVRTCEICAANKGPQTRTRGKMRQYNFGLPFERITIDTAEPSPVTDDGNRYIMVVSDYFTKWVEVYAILNQEVTTHSNQKELVHNFCSRYGAPMEIHTDQGRNFESGVFKDCLLYTSRCV